jgi:hypothetical protein
MAPPANQSPVEYFQIMKVPKANSRTKPPQNK